MYSFFTNAKYPDRVHIGVVQQNDESDEDIVVEYCKLMNTPVSIVARENESIKFQNQDDSKPCARLNQIRVIRIRAIEAEGPAYARALGNKMVKDGDDFCMQIDAHTKVVKDWDVLIIQQWVQTNNEYAVLSTYPTNVHDLGENTGHHWEMPHLCCVEGHAGIIMNCQAKSVANLEKPLLAPLWAAGLSFSTCQAERDVPNDIHLKGIFAGEEYGRGVRLWTHGYDFYSLSRPIVGTYYGNEKGGKGHWNTKQEDYKFAKDRLATLVEWKDSDQSEEAKKRLGFYSLGRARSLDDYINFTGINPRNGDHAHPKCAVAFVPWRKDEEERVKLERKKISDKKHAMMIPVIHHQQQQQQQREGEDAVKTALLRGREQKKSQDAIVWGEWIKLYGINVVSVAVVMFTLAGVLFVVVKQRRMVKKE